MPETNPKPILDMNYAFAQTALLVAAVQLRIFTHLADSILSPLSLAEKIEASPQAVERLMRGLQILGLVEQLDDGYRLAPLAAHFLVEGKPSYLGGDTLAMLDYLPAWFQLSRTMQTTQPYRDLGQVDEAEKFFSPRVKDLFPLTYPLAARLAQSLDLGGYEQPLQILDAGAGSAAWSAAFAQSYPASRVVAIDLPAVVAQGRQQIETLQLSKQYNWIEADLTTFCFPSHEYNLVLLAHVCRFMSDEQTCEVLERLFQSLCPGGVLVFADIFLNSDLLTPASAVMLDLSMLVNTSHGRIRSLEECQSWLEHSGFQQVQPFHVNGPFPVIVARKGAD